MEMTKNLIYLLLGLAALYYGADFLVRGGVGLARKLKISPLIIGLTIVAAGTSAPELIVSISSTLSGFGDIALGNVLGSNIYNIALILGLSALITPLRINPNLFRLDVPLLLIATVMLAGFCYWSGGMMRWEGAVFFAMFLGYLFWQIRVSRKEIRAEAEAAGLSDVSLEELEEKAVENQEEMPKTQMGILMAIVWILVGLGILVFGAKVLVLGAVYVAKYFSISDAVIGITIVAIGTSLPELATSLVAAIKGEKDIAVGNVIGSNLFNILLIMGVSPMICPIPAPGISLLDLSVMLLCTFLLIPMMWTGKRISRWEGACLLVIGITYTVFLVIQ